MSAEEGVMRLDRRWSYVRTSRLLRLFTIAGLVLASAGAATAQAPPGPAEGSSASGSGGAAGAEPGQAPAAGTREASIVQDQEAKSQKLHPYELNKAER